MPVQVNTVETSRDVVQAIITASNEHYHFPGGVEYRLDGNYVVISSAALQVLIGKHEPSHTLTARYSRGVILVDSAIPLTRVNTLDSLLSWARLSQRRGPSVAPNGKPQKPAVKPISKPVAVVGEPIGK